MRSEPLLLLLLIWLLISGAPSNTLAERRLESVTAHGFKPAFGHTEPRRGAEYWGEDLLVTFGWAGIPVLPKVTRCKSGTNSSRYLNNGYVPGLIQHPGQPSGRLRRQASSHILDRGSNSKIAADRQAASAVPRVV